jgi:hypothetical protein
VTPEQIKLLTGIVTESAVADDFFIMGDSYIKLANFLLSKNSLKILDRLGLEPLFSYTKRWLVLMSRGTGTILYAIDTPAGKTNISKITHRGEVIYTNGELA